MFPCLLNTIVFAFLRFFLLEVLLYKRLPFPHSTEVLSAVHMHKRLVMCLVEKIHVTDKPQSGMSQCCWPGVQRQ